TRGLARLVGNRLEPVPLGPTPFADLEAADTVWAAAFDADGTLWAARSYGITRVARGAAPRTLPVGQKGQITSGWGWLPSMVADRTHGVWVLTVGDGVLHVTADAAGTPVIDETLGGSTRFPRGLHQLRDGTLWIATTTSGLVQCQGDAGARRCTAIGRAQGLPDREYYGLASDTQGNLWAGSGVAGVVRLAAEGMTSWGEAEGFQPTGVWALQDDPQEGLIVVLGDLSLISMRQAEVVHRWAVSPKVVRGWGSQQILARGADGSLWLATATGLARYSAGTEIRDLATRVPAEYIDRARGLPANLIHRVFVARDGSVWFGLIQVPNGVCHMQGDGRGLRCYGPQDGLPDPAEGVAFAEDRAGGIWLGLYGGGLFRFRNGRFETWPETVPSRQSAVRSLRLDAQGRLWVAGIPGLLRVDAPEATTPAFRRYTAADGLSSHETNASADDRWGRVYVGGVHGLDRVDLGDGTVRRFTTADGLPANRVTVLHRDPEGVVWVGTARGLARLVPRPHAPQDAPRVFLTGVSVAGTARDPASPLALASSERTLEFAFTSPSFRAAETMRFQWRVLPSSETWSALGTARSIVLAGLSPGSYRFEVRAMDGEGQASVPTSAIFTIEPPLWRRGWFLALAAGTLAALGYAVYRIRVARLLEVERVRTRIATDLHDDIGASLSQIAVLSQAASRQAARGSAEAKGSLERITDLSGGVVDAMSDVVWSINPARDRMSDLVHRMRRFAVDLFADSDTSLELTLPEDADDARLDPDARRQIYLVFKEALRNVARHAEASHVEASLRREAGTLLLTVRDDGKGLGQTRHSGTGFGLQNMRRRAEAVGGTLVVRAGPGGGTEIVLRTGPVREGSKGMGAWLRRAP
ncbi:MAG TPA: two-component regulator propeller domain-containing protein, partial [Candidatus Polarisedimenticolaceae bacterium]|nr:two-component regulator propeller domain-containing protein [Candidatus Polarisedimenticolaceae bacterium]